MRRRQILPLAAGLLATPWAAFAWPDQPVKLVVPFTPGTGPDIIARFVAERLSQARPARRGRERRRRLGNIGSQQVARAKPDGHTLMSSVNTLVMNASLYKNLPYDPVADFVPLGLTRLGLAGAGRPSRPEAQHARRADRGRQGLAQDTDLRQPRRRHAASSVDGAGRDRRGIELLHVPYKGTAGAVQDLLGGQIGYMFLPVHVSAQHIRAGKLKAIAAGSPQRLPQLPDVPTLAEERPGGRRCRHVVRLLRAQGHADRDGRAAEQGGAGHPRNRPKPRPRSRRRGSSPPPRRRRRWARSWCATAGAGPTSWPSAGSSRSERRRRCR